MLYQAGFVLQGFYCVEGSSKPEPCPEGTYSNKKGLSGPLECSPCGHGFYCAAPGQTGPSGPCEAGFYCQGRALTPVSHVARFSSPYLIVLHWGGVPTMVLFVNPVTSRVAILYCSRSNLWHKDRSCCPQRECNHIFFPLNTNAPLIKNAARWKGYRWKVQWVWIAVGLLV